MSPRAKQLRFFVIALSLLVFLLSLNAKLSMYDQPSHVNNINSSKLWLNGQKMEAPITLVLAVLPVVFIVLRLRFHRSPWQRVQHSVPAPSPISAFELHRFLRPPPIP
jgi:hypothetical protein